MGAIKELLETLYSGVSPYTSTDASYVDTGYPHTNIVPELLSAVFTILPPRYIVECGSMLGGSAIKMAQATDADIVCIDPFTGDVNMWDWERAPTGGWRFLRLENGVPTIYKRFLANCQSEGFEERILPINCTTSVGIKLLMRLLQQGRITSLPNYIYLDSAHEEHETFVELAACWNMLPPKSILFGDDWDWPAVRADVTKFSGLLGDQTDFVMQSAIHHALPGSHVVGNILLFRGQWVLCKA